MTKKITLSLGFICVLFLAFVAPTYVAAQTFSPTVSVTLASTDCNDLTDLTINVSQNSGEVDMLSSLFTSNLGSFDIANMSIGDIIGSAVMSAGGGFNTFNTNLTVSSITSNQVVVQSQDINTGLVLGIFTITNLNPGVSITATTVPDGNNFTSGNSETVTFTNVFINPCVPLVFTSTINSELGDTNVQTFNFIVSAINDVSSVFRIYPNPVLSTLNIQLENNSSDFSVSIYDLTGKVVFSNYRFYNVSKVVIDVSHLSSSMYLMVISGSNTIESKTFYKE